MDKKRVWFGRFLACMLAGAIALGMAGCTSDKKGTKEPGINVLEPAEQIEDEGSISIDEGTDESSGESSGEDIEVSGSEGQE